MNKFLISILIGLMLLIPTVVSTSVNDIIQSKNSDILYVGGSGPGNYTSIQEAINNANDGDTVFVFDDSSPYFESVTIDRSIHLIGEDVDTTIIDAQHEDDAVEISNADNCFVSGFTIKNCHWSGTEYSHAVVSIFRSDYVIIKGNILTIGDTPAIDWTCAIELDNCTYCTIQNNFIFEDDYKRRTVGVSLHEGSSHNTISGNSISNYTNGVKTFVLSHNLLDSNNYNIISGNHIHHNLIGITILGDTYYEILNNRIEYNEDSGMYNCEAHHTTISDNIISYNGVGNEAEGGIILSFFTNDNNISDNVISYNNPTGVYMLTAVDNVVTRNNFIDNWGDNNEPESWWGNAFFSYTEFQWRFLRLNYWRRNYWSGHSGILLKAIRGEMEIYGLFYFPRLEFDWFPAKEPYDI